MKKLLRRKWLIPVAALVLTLTIGAVAWAATTPGSTDSTTATSTNSPSTTTPPTTAPSTTQPSKPDGLRGWCGRGGRFGDRAQLTPEQQQQLQQEQQQRQAERDAALKALRDKMSAADQATFDQLQATATQQRTALDKAAQDLKGTMDQLRALIQKYKGSATPSTTPSTGSSSTTTTGSTT